MLEDIFINQYSYFMDIRFFAYSTDFDEEEEEDDLTDSMMRMKIIRLLSKSYARGQDEYDESPIMMILMKR
jgi:hypothetical protein